jgi:hypothetical protein
MILFSRITWDLIHTWSSVTLILAGLLHFAIHWKWALKVTRKVLSFKRTSQAKEIPSARF